MRNHPPSHRHIHRVLGPDSRRVFMGRMGGGMLMLGALVSAVAHNLLRDPDLPGIASAPMFAGFAIGLVCVLAPWHRLPDRLLHVLPPLGTLLLAWASDLAGPHASVLLSFVYVIAVYAAYAFRSRAAIAVHVAIVAFGAIAIAALGEQVDPDAPVRLVIALPAVVAVAAGVMRLRERLEEGQMLLGELAGRDSLTSAGNHRALMGRLEAELARHARTGRSLAVLVMDIDDFKAVNEHHGHLEGDRVLREIAERLQATVRASDFVARQGGDEFSVLAPETDAVAATQLAARIEYALGRIPVGEASDRSVSASVGWAVYPDDGDTPEALLSAADQAERRTKAAHRAAARAPASSPASSSNPSESVGTRPSRFARQSHQSRT